MAFFPALPYTPHKVTPYFVEVCFRFVQTTVFLLPFSSSYFIATNFHQCLQVIFCFCVQCLHCSRQENVELVPVLSSVVLSSVFRFLPNRA